MSPELIQNLVTSYFSSLQAMNAVEWAENFTKDAVIYDPVGKPPSKARENAQAFFGLLSMAFEKLELSQDNVFIADNGAAVKWTMRVLGKSGKQGVAEGISVFEMHESGKFQQVSSYWNDAALMAQIKD
jgi:ketosteroid isomerase-like protein